MPNQLQPQGVSLDIDVSETPDTGFFVAEFTQKNTTYPSDTGTTIPNVINLTGNPAGAVYLIVPDALLRTHADKITINVAAVQANIRLGIVIPKEDYKKLKSMSELNEEIISAMLESQVPTGERWAITITRNDGNYSFTHQVLDNFHQLP